MIFKKILLTVILYALFFARVALATDVYCDFATGNNTTGDGSAGNPYKTIEKADDGLSGEE